jgi:Salmonella virulence plasmid 65kDa B protein
MFRGPSRARTISYGDYRPRVEGLFARMERWTNQTDPSDVFWRSISPENVTTIYDREFSRIFDTADPARIFGGLIWQSYDDKANAILYAGFTSPSGDMPFRKAPNLAASSG